MSIEKNIVVLEKVKISKKSKNNIPDSDETDWDDENRALLDSGVGRVCLTKDGRKYVRRISAYSRFVSERSASIRERLLSNDISLSCGLGLAILSEARALWVAMSDDEKSIYGHVTKKNRAHSVKEVQEEDNKHIKVQEEENFAVVKIRAVPPRIYFPVEDRWLDRDSGYFFETEVSMLALGMVVNKTRLIEFYEPRVVDL